MWTKIGSLRFNTDHVTHTTPSAAGIVLHFVDGNVELTGEAGDTATALLDAECQDAAALVAKNADKKAKVSSDQASSSSSSYRSK